MISNESIKYSLKNLNKRKTRSSLTIISIFIGIATIFIFISFGLGLYNYVNGFVSSSSADKITIQPKGLSSPGLDTSFALTQKDLEAVEKTSGVFEASGMYSKVVEVQKRTDKRYVFIGSYDPDKPLIIELSNLNIYSGRELSKNDRNKVILGYNYMIDDKIFPRGLSLNDKITINGQDFTVVGFFEPVGNPQDDSNVYINEDAYKQLFPDAAGYSMIIARADISNIQNVIKNVEKSVRKSRGLDVGNEDFYVASFEDLLQSYTSSLDIIVGFVILIALISVLVSAINTANTMITSVLERIKEIGVMKSVGARNFEIFRIFLFESSFLGLVAGVFGVIFGWMLSSLGGGILENLGWSFLKPYFPWQLFFGCILFAVITGAVSGVAPAIHASRISPVEALRYE